MKFWKNNHMRHEDLSAKASWEEKCKVEISTITELLQLTEF